MKLATLRSPFFQILAAIAGGIVFGLWKPPLAVAMHPLGTVFITIIKLMVVPLIFFTVSGGIAGIGQLKQLGRIGIKALLYFEALSALSLMTGIAAALLLQPGVGFHIDVDMPVHTAQPPTLPFAIADALTHSPLLQALMLALACGTALALLGQHGQRPAQLCERAATALLAALKIVLKAAPLAAFGAVSWSVGKYGLMSVTPLLKLLASLYLATAVFVLLVLGAICRACGFSVLRFIVYIKEELLMVFGTASSITAMAPLMEKMARAGCPAPVTSLVISAAYSFNLNGSNIYLGLALVFLAQALDISLSPAHLLSIVALAMITSKGASGVAGSAFVALAATLAAVPDIPASSLLFIVGIERLLKCRPLANLTGNGVACLAIAAWDGQLDRSKLRACGLART